MGDQQEAWSNAPNWTVLVPDPGDPAIGQPSNRAAGANDTARFTAQSMRDCTLSAATTVGALEMEGYASDKHLTLNATLTVSGGKLATLTPDVDKYAITGAGNLLIQNGTFTWSSGTMAGTGKTIVGDAPTLVIASSTAQAQDARLA